MIINDAFKVRTYKVYKNVDESSTKNAVLLRTSFVNNFLTNPKYTAYEFLEIDLYTKDNSKCLRSLLIPRNDVQSKVIKTTKGDKGKEPCSFFEWGFPEGL